MIDFTRRLDESHTPQNIRRMFRGIFGERYHVEIADYRWWLWTYCSENRCGYFEGAATLAAELLAVEADAGGVARGWLICAALDLNECREATADT